LIKLARAFPRSRFVGYDIFQPAILPATERAAAAGVSDRIRFEHRDVSKGLPEQFDVITTFDVIHDAVDPLGLLQAIRQALRPGGTYVCVALHRLIEEFVTGRRQADAAGRAVTTALFTDIVGSTQRAAHLGDAAWRQILDRHDALIREQVALYGGRFIESSGDGTLATFESPSRAIDCALALHEAAKPLGISLRAGLHTGEVELRDDGRVGGLAVHFGARVMAAAQAGEVLVSHTVHGILMGSRHAFAERGVHERKGVPGKWPLYAVRG
jgi:class 3 adenylate cyclase